MRHTLSRMITALALLAGILTAHTPADAQTADKIVAVVGRNRIILQSELEAEAANMKAQNPEAYHDSMRCYILQQMMLKKLLVEQAERDSVLVGEEEVEGTLDNRIRYFIARAYGSKEKMEQVTGRTIYQLKDEYREVIREQLLADKMQAQLIQHVAVTPSEVRAFYNSIPADSLPFFPAMVEVGELVIDPPVSAELDAYAREKLEGIRKQIVEEGKSFETMAGIYSDDPGSRDNGGLYEEVTRSGGWAPEFVAAAFKLQNGEVSPLVRTKFGYHIIQMVQRKGEMASVRHILVRPERTSADYKLAMEKLDSIRAEMMSGKLNFAQAVSKYSTDDAAKSTGGMIVNMQTGSSLLQVDQLDPELALMIDSLREGGISQPHVFMNQQNGERSCRIVFLKDRVPPHKANLTDDYNQIQQVALQQKQQKQLEQWLVSKLPSFFIRIDPEFQGCDGLKDWVPGTARQ